ncbi:uncharacterized protein AB675_6652 [Cyphellophora attinorum]|uniref:Uncharacterized protein n=1 Tax=Cyphellophora attinorum TaxID=1664694 RepID=A0A0N0NPV1_9EURO|nr:uncharacterized protein AB675_6652 [Phialophora attinorum]KPI43181.1 hypothetical protein AB675_6652 [Phialophora attinorum]
MGDQDKRMSTERGGESTQYESIKTVTKEPSKQSGQLGGGFQNTESATSAGEKSSKVAENIRYGQNISESGMGGFTNSTGQATQEGGYGGAPKDSSLERKTSDTRGAQGYGSGSGVGG